MTLRHMQIFRTVCEAGCNSTRAAELLHMTQPAVSLAIKELEEYYSVRLFERIGRRLRITEAGRYYLGYAQHISDLFMDMETGLRDWDESGVLRIGASITIGSQFLPDYIKELEKSHPALSVRVRIEPSESLEQRVLTDEIDLALIEGVAHSPDIVSTAYMEDALCVVCSAMREWENGEEVDIDTLRGERFLLRERGSGTRERFERAMEELGVSITPAWEATSTTALINATVKDIGITVLPYRMVRDALERGLVKRLSIGGVSFGRNFYIIYHKDKFLTPTAKSFIALCREFKSERIPFLE